ncbi:MAG: CoA-binding protein [Desulfobulbaceae bacterium]|nr:CoA-binding protein [Desulfobulbaceae bacterium]
MQLVPIEIIRSILSENTIIAVVGLSPKPTRPSHQVARYMQQAGYRIIPVNPGQSEILGQQCYPDLTAIAHKVDIVNIFRRSDQVEPVVRDAIAIGAKVIWMQQGIINEQAAQLAEANGLIVIMNRCISIDHQSFII